MEKILTYRELQQFNGEGGKPVYIAYKGKIYDVSGSDLWKTGRHQNRHDAGDDLTEMLAQAPHGEEMLEKMPVVGRLK
ncbi:MAG TPA: cytochrome b5 domain-containing protein [bacterium]